MFLNININYLANLRNSIGGNDPDILKCARYCEHAGADGIVAHVFDGVTGLNSFDIKNLRKHLSKFILKIPMKEEYKQLAIDCKPDIVEIMPFSDEISPKNGFEALKHQSELKNFIKSIKDNGSLTSVFVNPQIDEINSVYKANADFVELNSTFYAEAFKKGVYEKEFINLKECAILAKTLGLEVMLGTAITYQNAQKLKEIHGVKALNIGHSIMSKAIFLGLETAIKEMKEIINEK